MGRHGLAAARQVRDQDTVVGADAVVRIRQGATRDRRISIQDSQMRHGRKTKASASAVTSGTC